VFSLIFSLITGNKQLSWLARHSVCIWLDQHSACLHTGKFHVWCLFFAVIICLACQALLAMLKYWRTRILVG